MVAREATLPSGSVLFKEPRKGRRKGNVDDGAELGEKPAADAKTGSQPMMQTVCPYKVLQTDGGPEEAKTLC
jgi:hypothetical protein